MTFQPGAMVYTQHFGSRPENVEVPFYARRAPAATDVNYPIGKRWIYIGDSEWVLLSQTNLGGVLSSNWAQNGSSTGTVATVSGTANQITATTVVDDVTLSIPAVFVAPGSIEATTDLTVGGKLNVDTAANGSAGTTAALTAGSIVVANTSVTANSLFFFTTDTLGTVTAPQAYYVSSITPGVSFTITSASATDTSTVNFLIIN